MVGRDTWDRPREANGYGRYVAREVIRGVQANPCQPEMTEPTPCARPRDGRSSVAATRTLAFPFGKADGLSVMDAMSHELPSREDARLLVDCYYRHMSWK